MDDDLRGRGRVLVGPSRAALVVCQSLLGLTLALAWLALLEPVMAVHPLLVWIVAVGLAAGSAVFFWWFQGRDQLRETDEGLLACRRGVWRLVPWSDVETLAWGNGRPGGAVIRTTRLRTPWDDTYTYLCRPVVGPWKFRDGLDQMRNAAQRPGVPFASAAKDLDRYRVG